MTDDRLKSEGWHAALASSTRRRVLELLVKSGEALDAVAVSEAISLHVTTARFHLEQLEVVGLVQREVLRVPGQRGRPRVLFSIPASKHDGTAPGTSGPPQVEMQEQLSRALISVLSEDADGGRARAIRAGENWSTTLPAAVQGETAPDELEADPPEGDAPTRDAPAFSGPAVAATAPAEATTVAMPPSTRDRASVVSAPGEASPVGSARIEQAPAPVGLGAVRRTGRAGPYLTVLDNLGFAPELQGEGVVALRECPFREEARESPGVVCSVHLGLLRGVARALGQNEDDVGLRPFVTPTLCLVDLPGSPGAASAIKIE
ncbi:hypothetical protein E3T55_16965 [Cryobacterium frigoriphilum]|uniref:ArsR family transcriptional regulator n=1 Tax=Cryobacterium frigoriphilum TaxID=1259150 RepID=A0A4R8ZUK1_9MICO|nr:helix-turn-helix domain-containing protein [Cryobacterium frigoriphilum]TFD46555.1 hypothetical protein E3T55_16965 [Cryobacterium frigoriphilum]